MVDRGGGGGNFQEQPEMNQNELEVFDKECPDFNYKLILIG